MVLNGGLDVTMLTMNVLLETDRVVLRQFTPDDLDLLVELDNDPDVMRYINNGQPVERAEVDDVLQHWLGYYERFDAYGFWAAIEKRSGDFLGWFHFGRDRKIRRSSPSSDTACTAERGETVSLRRFRERWSTGVSPNPVSSASTPRRCRCTRHRVG